MGGGDVNEYEEGLTLFPQHVVSVGSLRGLLVGLLVGSGPGLVVIVRPLPIKALISRRRMGLERS